ncbi:hypothetical protein GYMLUDRAFT_71135 [Collybiopsis luxurians FD-317 M1]|nr:hypothetical protein GYMLUDRAFT_71135 [Collybiopsis luxurians FD-317 M1]
MPNVYVYVYAYILHFYVVIGSSLAFLSISPNLSTPSTSSVIFLDLGFLIFDPSQKDAVLGHSFVCSGYTIQYGGIDVKICSHCSDSEPISLLFPFSPFVLISFHLSYRIAHFPECTSTWGLVSY